MPSEEILRHMQNNKFGDVGVVKGSIIGKSYHIMAIKDPDYVILTMTTYGTLEYLEGSDTHHRYKGEGGELVTKRFNYREVFRNHFNSRHQVDDNKNWRHYTISVERNRATKYLTERCHAYLLELSEVNANYL